MERTKEFNNFAKLSRFFRVGANPIVLEDLLNMGKTTIGLELKEKLEGEYNQNKVIYWDYADELTRSRRTFLSERLLKEFSIILDSNRITSQLSAVNEKLGKDNQLYLILDHLVFLFPKPWNDMIAEYSDWLRQEMSCYRELVRKKYAKLLLIFDIFKDKIKFSDLIKDKIPGGDAFLDTGKIINCGMEIE